MYILVVSTKYLPFWKVYTKAQELANMAGWVLNISSDDVVAYRIYTKGVDFILRNGVWLRIYMDDHLGRVVVDTFNPTVENMPDCTA